MYRDPPALCDATPNETQTDWLSCNTQIRCVSGSIVCMCQHGVLLLRLLQLTSLSGRWAGQKLQHFSVMLLPDWWAQGTIEIVSMGL